MASTRIARTMLPFAVAAPVLLGFAMPGAAASARSAAAVNASQHATATTPGAVSRVTRRQLGKSWHQGCPTPPSQLRRLVVRFWGFDHRQHRGALIVNVRAVSPVRTAMATLDRDHFPIRAIRPVSHYQGKDNASMTADNTSAFNCRFATANGQRHWSEHAYGEAVDIDPRENPYVFDGRVLPRNGSRYADRSHRRAGMIEPHSRAERAFTDVGWGWGGGWSDPDYQHFSATGT